MTPSIEPPAERACERCEWFHSHGPVLNSGECRFNAPNVQNYPDGSASAWPYIQRTDWCAQFKERKG